MGLGAAGRRGEEVVDVDFVVDDGGLIDLGLEKEAVNATGPVIVVVGGWRGRKV